MENHNTTVVPVELLGVCPCIVERIDSLMIVLRIKTYQPLNYTITIDQAIRLRDDIDSLLKEYDIVEDSKDE